MRYPTFQETSPSKTTQINFGGLNYKEYCGEGEFSSQIGISSDEFPLLVGDNSFSLYASRGVSRGSTVKGSKLIYLADTFNPATYRSMPVLVINGEQHPITGFLKTVWEDYTFTLIKTTIGNRLLVCSDYSDSRDRVWAFINMDTYYSEPFGEKAVCDPFEGAVIEPCTASGGQINSRPESYYVDNPPADGDYKVADGGGLYQWNSTYSTWIAVTTTSVRILTNGGMDYQYLKEGDGVRITLDTDFDTWEEGKTVFPNSENGMRFTDVVISYIDADEIRFTGLLAQRHEFPEGSSMTIERRVPNMKYVTECNNRLWGCSEDGHEIYCSKLGDITNWYVYEGISTDAWAATVGTDGSFTGASAFNSNVFFFKPDTILKVIPSSSGAHVIIESKGRGAMNNDSIQIVNSVMYYLSSDCVCGFEGSVPFSVSDKLGSIKNLIPKRATEISNNGWNHDALQSSLSCAINDKYYLVIMDSVYAYDTKKGIWTKEKQLSYPAPSDVAPELQMKDDIFVVATSVNSVENEFVAFGETWLQYRTDGKKYASSLPPVLVAFNSNLAHLTGGPLEEHISSWEAVTGNIGYQTPNNKYISKINISCKPLDETAEMTISVIYDNSGGKIVAGTIRPSKYGNRGFNFTLIPKRCDHFQVMLEGKGKVVIYSITKTIEEGSDVV